MLRLSWSNTSTPCRGYRRRAGWLPGRAEWVARQARQRAASTKQPVQGTERRPVAKASGGTTGFGPELQARRASSRSSGRSIDGGVARVAPGRDTVHRRRRASPAAAASSSSSRGVKQVVQRSNSRSSPAASRSVRPLVVDARVAGSNVVARFQVPQREVRPRTRSRPGRPPGRERARRSGRRRRLRRRRRRADRSRPGTGRSPRRTRRRTPGRGRRPTSKRTRSATPAAAASRASRRTPARGRRRRPSMPAPRERERVATRVRTRRRGRGIPGSSPSASTRKSTSCSVPVVNACTRVVFGAQYASPRKRGDVVEPRT